ncbi:MAG: 3-phosphoshikimate 1-carboxyvinyltransferase [Bacillota bacterium]|jgi:3-phosphoshikimate 1-carboxyvinyltransferase
MKSLEIFPTKLEGQLVIQPSKSISHRVLICAALAHGKSLLCRVGDSLDIQATKDGLREMGLANFSDFGSVLEIRGYGGLSKKKKAIVDCKESGSTLRFLLPLALACDIETFFTGSGRLFHRPMRPFIEALVKGGAIIEEKADGIMVKGRLAAGIYQIPGHISSQYISGLLLALPLLKEPSVIQITGELQSADYVDLTHDTQRSFGINNYISRKKINIVPGKYHSSNYEVEGDWSHAAFYLTAGFLGSDIRCLGLNRDSKQGDRRILDILQSMGGHLISYAQGIKITAAQACTNIIDAAQIPDLVPILVVAACGIRGETRIINAERLRLKESDRLAAISEGITALGGNIRVRPDGLDIIGTTVLRGGYVSAWGDHRIAMALAIASSICSQPVILSGYKTVAKSAPHFWQEFSSLGGKINERILG